MLTKKHLKKIGATMLCGFFLSFSASAAESPAPLNLNGLMSILQARLTSKTVFATNLETAVQTLEATPGGKKIVGMIKDLENAGIFIQPSRILETSEFGRVTLPYQGPQTVIIKLGENADSSEMLRVLPQMVLEARMIRQLALDDGGTDFRFIFNNTIRRVHTCLQNQSYDECVKRFGGWGTFISVCHDVSLSAQLAELDFADTVRIPKSAQGQVANARSWMKTYSNDLHPLYAKAFFPLYSTEFKR